MKQRIFIGLILFGALTGFSAPKPCNTATAFQEFPKYCLPGCEFDENTQRCYCQI